MAEKGWGPLSPEASRCLRGLRATSLRKRASDWGPFRRYLRAHYSLPFPTDKDQILAYFAVRQEEKASRSVYRSLLLSLKFFEEAGEVPPARRLSQEAALESAAREHELRRREQAAAAGEPLGRDRPRRCSSPSW